MRRCTVAATQLDVRALDIAANLQLHLALIAEAAAAECDLIVFPELSVTGHNASPDVIRSAEPADGPIFREIHEQAMRCDIAVGYGFAELHRGTHYNSYAIVGPDGLIGLQRKVHASYDEFLRFRQAYEWNVFDLGFCRVGVAICHDSDFFETWRILALKGAELVLLPHANRIIFSADGKTIFDGSGREVPADEVVSCLRAELETGWGLRFHTVQARDNGVFAVFSDQVGFDGHSTHVGGAYILAADGATLARSDPTLNSSWIRAEIDPASLANIRAIPSFALRKRRPETYGELTARL